MVYHVWRILRSSDLAYTNCTSPRAPATSSLKNDSRTFHSQSPTLRGGELVQSQYIYVMKVFPLATLGDTEVLSQVLRHSEAPPQIIKKFITMYAAGGKSSFETPCNSFWFLNKDSGAWVLSTFFFLLFLNQHVSFIMVHSYL